MRLQCNNSNYKASHNNPKLRRLLKPEKAHTSQPHSTASLAPPFPACSPSALSSGKPARFEVLPSAEIAAKRGAAWGEEAEQSCSRTGGLKAAGAFALCGARGDAQEERLGRAVMQLLLAVPGSCTWDFCGTLRSTAPAPLLLDAAEGGWVVSVP